MNIVYKKKQLSNMPEPNIDSEFTTLLVTYEIETMNGIFSKRSRYMLGFPHNKTTFSYD